jgi:16S rRNA (cytosine967-C5)-methyltransferase
MGEAGQAARTAALELIADVLRRRRPLDESFASRVRSLEARDRAFARLLAATALRRLGQIDAAIDHCLSRPLPDRAWRVRDILRLGAVQMLFLGTPPHAAVDSAVRLAARSGALKGLVNAVLRRLAREGAEVAAGHDAAAMNTPQWLWESWTRAYGDPRARAIAEAHLVEPPLDFTARREPEKWAAALGAQVLPWGSLRRTGGGPVDALPGFDSGAWWVQDAAAALPARLLMGGVPGGVRGQRVLDLCAAPGGKTAQLAAAGAAVTALDASAERVERLRANLGRLGLEAATAVGDARHYRATERFPAVLLDAPCSATGTIRRHPDVARLKTPADVARLSALQDQLLAAALAAVAPDGVLVYAVCSLQPEECEARIEALLSAGRGVRRLPVEAAEVAGRGELVSGRGDVRTLPCSLAELGGLDGFYIARLRKPQ